MRIGDIPEHDKAHDQIIERMASMAKGGDTILIPQLIELAQWVWSVNEADATEIVYAGGLFEYAHPAPKKIALGERIEQDYMLVNAGMFFLALRENVFSEEQCSKINVNLVDGNSAVWGAKLTARQSDANTMLVDIKPRKFVFDFGKVVDSPKISVAYGKYIIFQYPVTFTSASKVELEFGEKMMEFHLDPEKIVPYPPKLTITP